MSKEIKKLYRSKKDKMIAGICAGIAEYFELDPTLIRLIYVAVTLMTLGTGEILYLLAWMIIPEKD